MNSIITSMMYIHANNLSIKHGKVLETSSGMWSGGVRSILLLPLVARYIETIDVCIWHMFYVCCSDCVESV